MFCEFILKHSAHSLHRHPGLSKRLNTGIRGFALCVVLAIAAGTGPIPSQVPDEIAWLDNYRDAVREAKRTQKPIFLEFRCEA